MLVVWRRWLEPLVVAVPLIVEAAAFITITFIVRRPRPDVPRLEGSPVDSIVPVGSHRRRRSSMQRSSW